LLNPPGGLLDGDMLPVHRKTPKRESCVITGSCGLAPGHTHQGPFRSSASVWWFHLMTCWERGFVRQALFIGFTLEILQVSQADRKQQGLRLPVPGEMPLCLPDTRVEYLKETSEGLAPGASPPGASFIVYVPPKDAAHSSYTIAFGRAFGSLGVVRV
jgi:hypothetical protein